MPFGIGVNGVLFEPGTAEFWMGNRSADWNYEALGGAVRLGLDSNRTCSAWWYVPLPRDSYRITE